jgi:ABC-type multidrug transport system fused ATPase/permease subunit
MRWPEFKRACGYGRTSGDRWSLYIIGVSAALLLPLLLADLGLLAHLVLGEENSAVPSDWVLGPWISGSVFDWPLFGSRRTCLFVLIAFGVVVGIVEAWALWLLNRSVHRAALGVVSRLQADVHRQAYRLGVGGLLGVQRSAPEQLLTETIDELYAGLLRWWYAVPYALSALVALVGMALVVNVWLALVVLLSLLLVRLLFAGFAARAHMRAAQWMGESQARRERLLQNIRLTPLATGYSLADAPGLPFPEMLGRYRYAELQVHDSRAPLGPTLLALVVWALACIVCVIGLSRYVTVAGTVVLTTAMIGAYFPAARLYRLSGTLATAEGAAGQLFAYLRREPGVRQVKGAVALDRVAQSIDLEHVTLANVSGVKLLDQLDLHLEAGGRYAVLASDRSASLALAGLLARLYDPAAGRVLFDGHNIASATLDTIRGQSLIVPAEGMLFEGTVQENISLGDAGFTTLQVTDAAKQARANNFVVDLPRGFSTKVGGDGLPLDVSQSFRIGLARALLRNPSVLIVEEPPDIFDADTSTLLDEALRLAAQDRTMIVLPAKLESLRQADQVVLLHEGKVLATGPHDQLLRSCELYRHLNYVRFHAFRHIR